MRCLFRKRITAYMAFRSSPDAVKALSRISLREWKRQLGWLDRSGLALPLIAEITARGHEKALPPFIKLALEQRIHDNDTRMQDMLDTLSQITIRFSKAGIRYACVKGFSLFPDYLPHPKFRHQSDFDFLIDKRDTSLAANILHDFNFKLMEQDGSGETRFATSSSIAKGRGAYIYHVQESSAVELHENFWEFRGGGISIPVPVEPLEFLETHEVEGIKLPCLQPTLQFTYQVTHFFRHLSRAWWCRLLWLYEIARFMNQNQKNEEFWLQLRFLWSRSPKLARICLLVLRMAEKFFAAEVPGFLTTLDVAYFTDQLWVEHCSATHLYADIPGNKAALLLLPPFFDSKRDYCKFRAHRLFPRVQHAPLEERLVASAQRSVSYRARDMAYQLIRATRCLETDIHYAALLIWWNLLKSLKTA
jgi:hypothetical protein